MKRVTAQWRSAARTDMGKVRLRNEDAFLNSPERGVWAVADGMGGHCSGDVASQLLVSRLGALPAQNDLGPRLQAVRDCLQGVNQQLCPERGARARPEQHITGSTVAVLLIEGRHGVCLWAGDSRCYLWRQHMLYQLSRDHSFQQRLIEQEHMSHRHACAHPDARALTRAVGAAPALALEVLEFEVQAGDVFLLCSDGIYQELTPRALGQALSVSAPELAVARLFDDVLSGAARDNLCAVVIAQ